MDFEQQQWFLGIIDLQSFDLSPDLQNIAYSQYGISYFTIIKLRKQVVRKTKIICPSFTFNVRYSQNGELIASTGCKPDIIYFWSTRTKKLIGRLECGFANSFVFQPDRNYLYTHMGVIVIWQTYTKISLNYVDAVAKHVEYFSKIYNNSPSHSERKNMTVTRINYNTGRVIENFHYRKKIDIVVIDSSFILSLHYSNCVSILSMRRCRLIRQLNGITSGCRVLTISPDKKFICCSGWLRETWIYDLQTAIKYQIPGKVRKYICYAKFSSDSKFFIQQWPHGLIITPISCCTSMTD